MSTEDKKTKNVKMDRKEILDFIYRNINKNESLDEIEEGLIEVIFRFIPLLGHYEEESKKINFSIALGMNTDVKNLIACSYVLKTYTWTSEGIEDRVQKIEKMIRQVAIFCEKDANIFLVKKDEKIECGIYYTVLSASEKSEDSFLENNFIIFEHLYRNKVIVNAKKERMCICMDFEEEPEEIYNTKESSQDPICRKWRGIFERVKRNVHGTICLFVNPEWNAGKDSNFTSEIEEIHLDLKINNNSSADEIQNFNNELEMFLAMLNYDGITIIDTNESIRAYNLFCRINDADEGNINGGARHRAYQYLKTLAYEKRSGYVAIYFQSQEGEIEFYKFNDSPEQAQEGNALADGVEQDNTHQKSIHYFDASIMNIQSAEKKMEYEKTKKKYQKIQKSYEFKATNDQNEMFSLPHYYKLKNLVDELDEAHNGIDNFYNEPAKANELEKFIEDSKDDVMNILCRCPKIRKELLSIVFRCIVGNSAGFSWNAQDSLDNILKLIEGKIYKMYFENEEYLDVELLWTLSRESLYERWKAILSKLKKYNDDLVDAINEKKATFKEYGEMYYALMSEE